MGNDQHLPADDRTPTTPEQLAALAAMQAAVSGTLDLADAHRAACIARGYTPQTAERLTVVYYAMMMRQIGHGVATTS